MQTLNQFKNSLKILLVFSSMCISEIGFSQCTNLASFGSATAPTTTTPLTISTCTYNQEYNTIFSVVGGQTYVSTNSSGGCITVHSTTPGGPVVAFGPSPLTWVATVSGTYYIHYNVNCACATATGCITTTITCTSCGAGPNPCTSITNIPLCGTPVTANLTGTGAWNVTACGFTTSGTEQIYSFTPTTTGTYTINVTAASGGFIDYFWINSTSGCGPGAPWTCLQDIISTGTYGSMAWTAGQTYYILLDPEPTSATSQTFNIGCPSGGGSDPCAGIINIASCGNIVNANLTGSGFGWNIPACGFSTLGDEQIYSFTATTTGTYTLNVSSTSGGFIDYFWVNSTSGCSAGAPWNCIDDILSVGSYGAMPWVAGQTYYILLDPESTAAAAQSFSIDCPGSTVTAGDCGAAVNVCTNLTFAVDPSGFGAINEIPALGSVGNPNLVGGDFVNSAWGSDHWGCLRAGELNSTWMVVNVATGGMLNFSFGAVGGFNCYDWIMYPYSPTACAQIPTGTFAPVRCNWNSPCASFTGIASTPPAGGAVGNFEPDLAVLAGQQYIICFSNYSSALTNVPLNFFGTATVSCTPLPVELSSFNGHKIDENVLLNWNTETEINVSHFQVMHSTDGINFKLLEKLSPKGSSSLTQYELLHNNPSQGMNYYKLITVDFDSQTKESGVLAIDFSKEEIFVGNVYPNPANGLSYVEINSIGLSTMEVNLSDVTGKIVYSQQVNLRKGLNKIEINTKLFESGIYLFSVSNTRNSSLSVQKLIIE